LYTDDCHRQSRRYQREPANSRTRPPWDRLGIRRDRSGDPLRKAALPLWTGTFEGCNLLGFDGGCLVAQVGHGAGEQAAAMLTISRVMDVLLGRLGGEFATGNLVPDERIRAIGLNSAPRSYVCEITLQDALHPPISIRRMAATHYDRILRD
jgi:hypothetical protein